MKRILNFKEMFLEAMNERSIPDILKEFSEIVRNDLINKTFPYKTNYTYDVFNIDVSIVPSNRYYSNINIIDVIQSDGNPINLVVEIEPNHDIDYIVATIIHETRHIYDIFTVDTQNDMKSFIMDKNIRTLRVGNYSYFIDMIYLSLEHELISRNNMVYTYIKFKNISLEQAKKIMSDSTMNHYLTLLGEFNHKNFTNSMNIVELTRLTNLFKKMVLLDEEPVDDVGEFYKTWEIFFKKTSIEWKEELEREITKIYEHLKPNSHLTGSWHTPKIGYANKLLIEIYK